MERTWCSQQTTHGRFAGVFPATEGQQRLHTPAKPNNPTTQVSTRDFHHTLHPKNSNRPGPQPRGRACPGLGYRTPGVAMGHAYVPSAHGRTGPAGQPLGSGAPQQGRAARREPPGAGPDDGRGGGGRDGGSQNNGRGLADRTEARGETPDGRGQASVGTHPGQRSLGGGASTTL